jgi:hypothetical protein
MDSYDDATHRVQKALKTKSRFQHFSHTSPYLPTAPTNPENLVTVGFNKTRLQRYGG